MPEIIAGVLLSFFAVIGIAETGYWLKKYLLTPLIKKTAFVVTCSGHDEQIEYCVRSLANQASEFCRAGEKLIVIVDAGMDDETRGICEKLEHDIEGVTVCKTGDLNHVIGMELQN